MSAEPESADRAGPGWRILLRPKWLCWHLFAVLATVGMFYLGDWQLHRAEAGNELSWAYTFEWPIFAICGVYFWFKSLRDELHPQREAAVDDADAALSRRLAEPDSEDAAMSDDAYLARLKAEVQGHGKWRGMR